MRRAPLLGLTGLTLLTACLGPAPDLGAPAASRGGDSDGAGTDEPPVPELLCADGEPLVVGDASWAKPPFEPPAAGAPDPEGETGGDSDDGWGTGGGIGFISDPDGGGVSIECSIWDQDCARSEKCSPWANDGGEAHNATKCSPVDPNPAAPGDPCSAEGSGYSGVDDCELGALCWEVDENLDGTCVAHCTGSEANPECPPQQWCWIGNEGVLVMCLPDDICADDGACQCMCPDGVDPDCEEGQCDAPPETPALHPLDVRNAPVTEAETTCPDDTEPVVLYMSNDDSNSQASPVLARRFIEEGGVVPPDRVRIHEFLNYYDLNYDNPTQAAAKVGIQMRRSDADAGEFTLVVSARSRQMKPEDRPPLNLVFSLDTSGSMSGEPLSLLKDTMVAVAGSLRAGDTVSMVTWSTVQDFPLSGYVVQGPDDPELLSKISSLESDGGTDLHAGLVAAYQLADTHHIDDGINRVMLISDGGANTGITDIDLIASEAQDNDGEGTYLIGVGVGTGSNYRDDLMDEVTDAGKGAYVYIDRPAEAEHMFGTQFLSNVLVVARNVRTRLTLPWYFGVKQFHGEEYSSDPAEIEPQHLGPNDTMTFHQVVGACDASYISDCDSVSARIEYSDPLTGDTYYDERTVPIEDLVVEDAKVLYKSDVIVGYAKSLIVIGMLSRQGNHEQAQQVAQNMATWASAAAAALDDAEVAEIAALMTQYAGQL